MQRVSDLEFHKSITIAIASPGARGAFTFDYSTEGGSKRDYERLFHPTSQGMGWNNNILSLQGRFLHANFKTPQNPANFKIIIIPWDDNGFKVRVLGAGF